MYPLATRLSASDRTRTVGAACSSRKASHRTPGTPRLRGTAAIKADSGTACYGFAWSSGEIQRLPPASSHVAPVAIPGRVLRAYFGGHEVAPRWQGLPGLDLRRDILGCAAFEAIDTHQIIRPFRSRLGFAEGQAAPARLRHQLRHPAAGETGGIGVLVVNPDVHIQPFGLLECDLR